MSLEDLLREQIIYRVKSNHKAAIGLLKSASQDLKAANKLLETGDYNWSITIHYNSMLRSARALMADSGYRPSSVNGHIAVIRFLRERQKGSEWETCIIELDRLRRKRHELVYEEPEEATKKDAYDAKDWAEKFITLIETTIVVGK